MKIKKLHIQNFKSLVDFQLEDMPQFCAFVGPNASGKSNIFEAIEFANYTAKFSLESPSFFGGNETILNYNVIPTDFKKKVESEIGFFLLFENKLQTDFSLLLTQGFPNRAYSMSWFNTEDVNLPQATEVLFYYIANEVKRKELIANFIDNGGSYANEIEIFFDNFSRIFVGKPELIKIKQSSNKLQIDGSNTAQIIGQIFQHDGKREDFIEWLRILIPEFENIEVKKNEFDGSFHIFVKEKTHDKHFPVTLLSDGTKNILALMAAVYQSNQPQFLCIEEPENGLHPHAIELLVDFFREKCETQGHHIWLNTHSPTLVRCLAIDEVITVNKINGETKARQFKKEEAINMKMDEAWLTNALGGGVSWSK